MCDVFSAYSLSDADPTLVQCMFSLFYNSCQFPLDIAKINWSAFVRNNLPDQDALKPYESIVVIKLLIRASPTALCKSNEACNILFYFDAQIKKMFVKAVAANERRYMYTWLLRFLTDFLTCLQQAIPSTIKPAASTSMGALFRRADAATLERKSGKVYVDEFAGKTKDATQLIADMTARTGGYTVKSFANILNGLTPMVAALANINPNGAKQERMTNDVLSKTRKYFDDKIASGELQSFAAIAAKALPESSKRFTEYEYALKVEDRRQAISAEIYDEAHKKVKGNERKKLEEQRKKEIAEENESYERLKNVVHESTMERVTAWLMRSNHKMSKIERQRDALYRRFFPFTAKHDLSWTLINRLSMLTSIITAGPGIAANASMLIQPVLRMLGRPQLYMLISRLLSALPAEQNMGDFITLSLNVIQHYTEPIKPFLPVIEMMLKYTYPVWSKLYTYLMSYARQTADFLFNKLFPLLPDQRTITISTNAVAEVGTGLIHLLSFIVRSTEMLSYALNYLAIRIAWWVIRNFGTKIVALIAAA